MPSRNSGKTSSPGSIISTATDLLVFDEIQEAPRALTSLKYFSEEKPELAVCGAGSLLGLHLADSSFPVGKVEFLALHPLSFGEFLRGIGEDRPAQYLESWSCDGPFPEVVHERLWELLKSYFIVAGLPEAVTTYAGLKSNPFRAFEAVRKKQLDLITAYLADVAKHSGKVNSMHIDRVWRSVPAQLARAQDGSSSKFAFKGVVPGVQGYARLAGAIDWLRAAGLGNAVSWRENTAEVEFLLEMDGRMVPLEVKSGWVTQAKSLKVFAEKYRPPRRVTLSARNFSRNKGGDAFQVPLYLVSRLPGILAA